jgi:hypothetical protein
MLLSGHCRRAKKIVRRLDAGGVIRLSPANFSCAAFVRPKHERNIEYHAEGESLRWKTMSQIISNMLGDQAEKTTEVYAIHIRCHSVRLRTDTDA